MKTTPRMSYCGFTRVAAEVNHRISLTGISHRPIGEIPAWSVVPYISLWAIESHEIPRMGDLRGLHAQGSCRI